MKFILDIIKGIVIGLANIIPGVSGGTMMVSMGIYDTIISCITGIFKNFKKNLKTLAPYIIGMLVGIGGFSIILKFLFKNYPLPTNTAFVGLILGGLPSIAKQLDKRKLNIKSILIGIIFFVALIVLQFLNGGTSKVLTPSITSALILIIIGAIASATMVIPGVSGSLVMVLLGYYEGLLGSVSSLVHGLKGFDLNAIGMQMLILVPFGIGVILGIFFVAKLIEYLLKHYYTYTYCGILGLVLTSPIIIFMNSKALNIDITSIIISVISFVACFILSKKLSAK